MANERRCHHCDEPFEVSNPKARYCSLSCRVMACQQRKLWRGRVNSASRSIEGCAPPGANSYRLISQPPQPWAYFHFGLKPFEPPRVPYAAVYNVEYFDEQGRSLGTPHSISMGIYVKAPDLSAS